MFLDSKMQLRMCLWDSRKYIQYEVLNSCSMRNLNICILFFSGMLLRWFVNLYDLEIIEEDAFLTWKEDLSQDYPGKGKALFQVSCRGKFA